MIRWLRQALCLHWFEPTETMEFTESGGAIVCCQQKQWRYTRESRTCSRCGLQDTRRVGEPIFKGWN